MHRKVVGFARAARRCNVTSKLTRVGTLSAQFYGHHLHGVFGAAMLGARRQLGAACGTGKKGR
eukprot:964933-Pyramimonas_sp.AAC.1